MERFRDFEARVVFSAEEYCWPDESLVSEYPAINRGKRFLNSGGFIGYASDIYEILNSEEVEDASDDQLFYTRIFLDPESRDKHKIKLDHKSRIFQNLNGAKSELFLQKFCLENFKNFPFSR